MTANILKDDVDMTFPEEILPGCTCDYGEQIYSIMQLTEENSCPLRRHQSPNTHYDIKSYPLIRSHAAHLHRVQILCGFTVLYSS